MNFQMSMKMDFDSKVRERYQGDNGKKYQEAVNIVPDKAYPWVNKTRLKKLQRYVNEYDTVLEYGVGTGWNMAGLVCKRRIGYDISSHLEPVLKSHAIEFVGDIKNINDATVDVVICHHVLEHTGNPPAVLLEIKRILNEGGKLLLFVPYETGKKYRTYNPQEPNHHMYSWNVQTLGNLVETLDFKVLEAAVARFGYDRFAGVWADRLGLGEPGFRVIRRLIHFIRPGFEIAVAAQKP